MSKTESLHYELCLEGARWLHRAKWNYDRCRKKDCYRTPACGKCHQYKYVAVELCTWGSENTDVWGLGNFNESVVIEVKTSHADFLADQKKYCRSEHCAEQNHAAGMYRWYLCPEGVIRPEELPDKWGLLYWNGKKVYPVIAPQKFENTQGADMEILTSILRREGFPAKIYNYRGTRTTIRPKTLGGIPLKDLEKQNKR